MAFLEVHGANTADSSAVTIVGDIRPANPFDITAVTFTELVASTSENWAGFHLNNAQGTTGIINIWKGPVSSEVLVATLPATQQLQTTVGLSTYIPIPLPSGTRLSLSFAAETTASVNEVQVLGIPSSNFNVEPNLTNMDCGPFDLTQAFGLYGDSSSIVDPGAVANTEGSYLEISHTGAGNDVNNIMNGASLPYQYKYLGFLFDDTGQAQTAHSRLWTIAYGAAASEVDFMTGVHDYVSGSEINSVNRILWIPWDRPAGDRISAKMQASITDAADRLGQVIMFGLR